MNFSLLSFIYYDKWYFILIIPAILLSLFAQFRVRSAFNKYGQIPNSKGLTGSSVAQGILTSNGIYNIVIEPIRGQLTDHFSPKESIIRLSEPVYGQRSIAALGVAAHEVGHALQYAEEYGPMKWRQAIYPLAGIGSSAGPYLALFGLIMQADLLFTIGIMLYAAAVFFFVITLPVELNASRRALAQLEQGNYLTSKEELEGARNVLGAAALTYVASAATAFVSLLRLILIRNESRR